jgi:hypothetical protein
MKTVLLGVIIGCVIWQVVWKLIILRVYGQRIIDWTDRVRKDLEKTRIQRGLKQGQGSLEIAQDCNYHNQDDILAIKTEMWNNGWENY